MSKEKYFHMSPVTGKTEPCTGNCDYGENTIHGSSRAEVESKVEEANASENKGSFGTAVSGQPEESSTGYNVSKNEYAGEHEVREETEKNNADWGITAKKVKDFEQRAIGQATYANAKAIVVKKRKDRKTGYRDTTVYSADGERFVTIRANEDNPNSSYFIRGTRTDMEPFQNPIYLGADSAVSSLNKTEKEAFGPSASQKRSDRIDAKISADNVLSGIEIAEKPQSDGSPNGIEVERIRSGHLEETHVSFYNGKSLIVRKNESEYADRYAVYEQRNEKGEITSIGELNKSSSAKVEYDLDNESFKSKSSAEFDKSTEEIQNLVENNPEYSDFKVRVDDSAFEDTSSGYQRHVFINGKTDGIVFEQHSGKTLSGHKETMYDLYTNENLEDGGIYMKSDPPRNHYTSQGLSRYLDALKRKDEHGDKNIALYEFFDDEE